MPLEQQELKITATIAGTHFGYVSERMGYLPEVETLADAVKRHLQHEYWRDEIAQLNVGEKMTIEVERTV